MINGMSTKHTPGPWFAVDYAGSFCIQSGPTYEDKDLLSYDSFSGQKYCVSIDTAEANATLAAAAPDLLEACLTAKAMYEAQGIKADSMIGGEQYSNLLIAIKKATGHD